MKKPIFLSVLLLGAVLLFSCNKITENKLHGSWTMSTAYRNGTDYSVLFLIAYPNYKLTFNKNGTYLESYGTNVNTGLYVVQDKGKTIVLNPNSLTPRVYSVVKISGKKMDVKGTIDFVNQDEYNLIKQK
jgi:hypothetical protein